MRAIRYDDISHFVAIGDQSALRIFLTNKRLPVYAENTHNSCILCIVLCRNNLSLGTEVCIFTIDKHSSPESKK